MILSLGALLGFIAVAFGAFAEHGLRENISDEHFRFLMTAVRYNQIHAVIISAIGLVMLSHQPMHQSLTLKWSGFLFIIGTVLFSCSIYISVSINIPLILNITPIGGMTIMIAWLLLAYSGIVFMQKRNN